MAEEHNHSKSQSKGSPYKLLNELEQQMQDNYSITVLSMSKAVMTEVNKEINKIKDKNEFF